MKDKRKRLFSSLSGEHKELSTSYKRDEVCQFTRLTSYCKNEGISLNKDLTGKGD